MYNCYFYGQNSLNAMNFRVQLFVRRLNYKDGDVIHINTVFPKSFFLALKSKRLGIPVIYHAHSTKEDFRNSYIGSNLFAELFRRWITLCYNLGDIIITPSEYSKHLLESYNIHTCNLQRN